jgi:tagatose-1,6-bisphosphate aldolase non-catalytic subunit AgaZ/GatZ
MLTTQAYQITSSNEEIIIKLNRNLIEQEKLEQFLDYLFIKSVQQKSELSEKSANELINEIDNVVWEKQKGLFEI